MPDSLLSELGLAMLVLNSGERRVLQILIAKAQPNDDPGQLGDRR